MQLSVDSNVLFANEEHKRNFHRCMEKFQCSNREYISTCYLASLPEIFKCFTLQFQVNGPFDWFFEHIQDPVDTETQTAATQSIGSTAPLTSQTTALVQLALNLWNGHEFDLARGLEIWDADLYVVALQAIDLRRHNP